MSTFNSRAEDRSVSELLSDVSSEVSELVKKEIELAKIETRDQVSKAAKAGAMLGAGGVGAFVGLLLASMAAAWGLAEVMPPGFAFLIVAILFFLVAGALAAAGRKKMKQVQGPKETMRTLKEDVQIAKDSISRGASATPSYSSSSQWSQQWQSGGGR
jgi:uncharacterized membrane protein YqjE